MSDGLMERFTDRARTVCQLAQKESWRVGERVVGCEHILAAMLFERNGVAGQVLDDLGITLDAVRSHFNPKVDVTGIAVPDMPFTSISQAVLEEAVKEARNLSHDYVGTEHLLLALTTAPYWTFVIRIFNDYSVTCEMVRKNVMEMLGHEFPKPMDSTNGRFGVTLQERAITEMLASAYRAFNALPQQTTLDMDRFCRAINDCQATIGMRVARRLNPEVWK